MKNTSDKKKIQELKREILELNQLINAIRSGKVDALVIENTKGKESIATIEGEEQPYRTLIENMTEGAVTLDREGKIMHCNKQFAKMLMLPAKKIITSSFFEYIPESQHKKLSELLNQTTIDKVNVEFNLHIKKNNTDKTVLLSCNAMSFGNIKGISITVTDITNITKERRGRIHAQEELIKNEELFRQFTETISDVFWRMTPEMDKITYISPSYEVIWKKSRESLYLNPFEWMDLIVEADKYNVKLFLDKLRTNESASVEYSILLADGIKKFIFSKGFQVKNTEGKLTHIIGIASDITELRQMREKIYFDDKLRTIGILAASVAHEINNPIAWILANLSFIKKNISTLDQTKLNQLMNESIQGAERIRDIVRDFKGFARVNDNEITYIDVQQLLDSAINMVAAKIKQSVLIKKKYAANMPPIKGNNGKLHQVFLNLIMNAFEAMPEADGKNKEICISTSLEKNQARIDVSDTGHGIKPENLDNIFDPFYTTKQTGTGLGLSISYQIIKSFGGEITIKSVLGEGSTFSVFLPLSV